MDPVSERLRLRHPQKIDLSLDRMRTLCAVLGNPQDRLPPVIHVAGTNGKGSTIAFIRAMAEAAGLKAHVYTSPHLVRFNERIRLAGELISDETTVGDPGPDRGGEGRGGDGVREHHGRRLRRHGRDAGGPRASSRLGWAGRWTRPMSSSDRC